MKYSINKETIAVLSLLLLAGCQGPIQNEGMMTKQANKFKEAPLNAAHGEVTPGVYNTANDLRR